MFEQTLLFVIQSKNYIDKPTQISILYQSPIQISNYPTTNKQQNTSSSTHMHTNCCFMEVYIYVYDDSISKNQLAGYCRLLCLLFCQSFVIAADFQIENHNKTHRDKIIHYFVLISFQYCAK